MPAIDQLINDLRADGAVDSQGSFTLDREQARAKMQKFQLVDARRYVLELVQAAVLRGATQIEFEIDADDMRMRFDGAPFVQAEIDDLYGSLFRDGDTRELRGVRQLALALNAALGLNPKYIEMRSGAVELRMVPGEVDQIDVCDQAVNKTQIHVRQRLRARVFVDFFRDLAGGLPEESYLNQRCCYCTVPVTLDGTLISREPSERGLASIPIDGREFRGVMTIVEHSEHLELRLVKDGVWIDTHELRDVGTNVLAVVEGDTLRKDVSQAKIVADAALEEIERSLARGRWRLWKTAAEQLAGPELTAVAAMIRTQLLHHIAPADLAYIADAHALASQVVWDDCRDRERQISLRNLIDLVAAGETPSYATTAYLEQQAKGAPILYIEDLDDIQALARVLGRTLVHADGLLALERRRIRGREAWLGRAGQPKLPSQVNFAVRSRIEVELESGRIRGEIGVDDQMLRSPDIAAPVQLFIYNDGRLLGRSELDLNLPNVWIALEAGVTPNDDYTDAQRDATFARVLLHGLAALSDSCVSLFNIAEGNSSRNQSRVLSLIKHWLMSMVDPGAQLALLAAAGCDATSSVHVPVAKLLPNLALEGLLGATKTPNYLAQLALFDALVGPRRSLTQLAASGQITYVQEWPSNRQLVAEGVLVLGPGDRRILAALFGHSRLQKWDMEPKRRELEFHQREPVSIDEQRRATTGRLAKAGLDSEHWLVDLGEGPTRGFVIAEYADGAFEQLAELELDEFDEAQVWIRYRDRALCELSLEGCFGPLHAAVEHPGLQPSPRWDDVVRDQAFDQVAAAVRHASEQLFARLCRSYAAQPPAAQRWLARVLLRGIAAAPKRRLEIAKHVELLATVEGRTLSLARASAVIEAHAKLEYASRDAGWAPLHDPPVIVAEDGVLADLRAVFGDALVDGNDRVRHHTVLDLLEHRPPLTEAKLDPSEISFSVELRGDAQIGEVGISNTRREPGLRLRLGVAGREVEVLREDQYIHLPLEAVAIDEQLPLTAEGRVDARSKRVRALVRQCRRRVPALILGVCEAWADLSEPERAVAWRMLVAQLTVEADQDRRKQREQAFDAAAAVLGFRDVQGQRHSLVALLDAAKYRPLDVLTGEHFRESTLEFAGSDRLILTVDSDELECLRAHCEVREIDEVWEAELAALRSFAQAPIVERPNIQEVALAYRKAMAAGGLDCELWLPRDASLLGGKPALPTLIFARAERELERRVLFETLPCAGIVSGDGLIASGGEVELDQRQRVSLERQVLIMYLELAQAVASDRVASKDHADALAYLAWVDHRLRSDADALELQGKRYLELRRLLDQLVPPSLRDALTRRDAKPTPAQPSTRASELITTTPQPVERPADPPADPPAPLVERPAASVLGPEQRLLAAVYEQLHWARATHRDLLDDLLLNHVSLETTGAREIANLERRGLVINRDHPIVARLLFRHGEHGDDPFELAFLVAALYSLMNYAAVEISDDDERRFVAQLAESLALSIRASG